jgi:hypothetical protein
LNINDILVRVDDLNRNVKPAQAQAELGQLIDALSIAELRHHETRLRESIGRFLPKRHKALMEKFARRIDELSAASKVGIADAGGVRRVPAAVRPASLSLGEDQNARSTRAINDKFLEFTNSLSLLSQHHIFQWSTHYRYQLSKYFDWFFGVMDRAAMWKEIEQRLSFHSKEIFQKGFQYLLHGQKENQRYAIGKSISGLQSFLDLPIEFYSTKLPFAADVRTTRRLRTLTSAMLVGILAGYAEVDFDEFRGGQVLPRYVRSWAHTLPFLTAADLESLVSKLEPGEFRDAIIRNVVPLVEALDKIGTGREHAPFPALSQFQWASPRRLEVSLRQSSLASDPQLIQIHCYFEFIDRPALEEANSRNVTLVVGPVRSDLRTFIGQDKHLQDLTVVTDSDPATTGTAREAILSTLNFKAYRQGTRSTLSQPLQYNYASEFPLDYPALTRYAHVYRQSVQDLLRAFDRRNGIRLWCSVRRSGKTTAGFDLGSTTGRSTVISQTCDSTGRMAEDDEFYLGVANALTAGKRIPSTFISDLITKCSVSRRGDGDRIVFVLDEYETLFGEIRRTLRVDPDIRYPVVQPLLNQMVGFSQDNLLVFLGQQPDAHYVLMDQNQLSPYVKQDPFPLFFHEHGDADEEFTQFVAKVLANKVDFEPSFVDELFRETAGHPFLTVKLLIEIMDWLIESGRPAASLKLTAEDIHAFAGDRLHGSWISMVREYVFFRRAAAEAMSVVGREQTPWLHAVYSCLSELGRSSPESLTCTRTDFRRIAERVTGPGGDDPDLLLAGAAQSNFFSYDEELVRPKVRLLCRIAATSHGSVGA